MLNLVVVLALVNVLRAQPLIEDKTLDTLAQHRAEYLCAHNQWSHEGWIDSFKGIKYQYAGENLAKGYFKPSDAVFAWYLSPTHKANMLNPHYHKEGLGQACGIIVQLFTN